MQDATVQTELHSSNSDRNLPPTSEPAESSGNEPTGMLKDAPQAPPIGPRAQQRTFFPSSIF